MEIARKPTSPERKALEIDFSAPFVQESRFAVLKTF